MLKTALIVGSTRPNRFVDRILPWLTDSLRADGRLDLTVLDLKEHPLPFFNEGAPPTYIQGAWSEAASESWRQKIAAHDAFIATVPEYNHAPAAVLKNAFDSAYFEWNRKPVGFVGYGGAGAARAIVQMREVAAELQMQPLRHEMGFQRADYMAILGGQTPADLPWTAQTLKELVDHLVWWGEALKAHKAKTAA